MKATTAGLGSKVSLLSRMARCQTQTLGVIPPCGAKRQPHVLKFIHMGREGPTKTDTEEQILQRAVV